MPCRCGAGAPSRQLTEDEQRAARTAEIAAAEDFDPLRIRPYVTLTDLAGADGGEAGGPRSGSGTGEGAATGTREHPATGTWDDAASRTWEGTAGGTWDGARPSGIRDDAASRTWEGSAAGTGPSAPDAEGTATGAAGAAIDPGAAASTMPLFLGGDGLNGGMGTGMDTGTGTGMGMGSVPDGSGAAPDGSRRRTAAPVFAPDPVRPRRRRPLGALAVGAAVAAVVGTAAFAGGLFGGGDSGDEALPEATTSVPDTEDEPAASVAPSPSASATSPRTQSPSATPSASPSAPPSASASPTKSREPSPAATASASPKASASPTPTVSAPPSVPPPGLASSSLRPGDRGPEVAELQNRLQSIGRWLYPGPVDGSYTDQVAHSVAFYQSYKSIGSDPTGVYGPSTRSALEAETSGPRRH
ncbi:peptidoglycan-binding protein [Streptomyces sp. NPDC017520]|uniref:peptidoglycan-binding protein n=1 Tax=Streptomyces sp. NPDC017520 TaxID=3364998 RepID=UPI0037B27594